jgi:hypothetical protein
LPFQMEKAVCQCGLGFANEGDGTAPKRLRLI